MLLERLVKGVRHLVGRQGFTGTDYFANFLDNRPATFGRQGPGLERQDRLGKGLLPLGTRQSHRPRGNGVGFAAMGVQYLGAQFRQRFGNGLGNLSRVTVLDGGHSGRRVGVVLGALDGEKHVVVLCLRLDVEDAAPRIDEVLGGHRAAVAPAGIVAKRERVDQSVGRDRPALGDAGAGSLRGRIHHGQPLEQGREHSTIVQGGRFRRIEGRHFGPLTEPQVGRPTFKGLRENGAENQHVEKADDGKTENDASPTTQRHQSGSPADAEPDMIHPAPADDDRTCQGRFAARRNGLANWLPNGPRRGRRHSHSRQRGDRQTGWVTS